VSSVRIDASVLGLIPLALSSLEPRREPSLPSVSPHATTAGTYYFILLVENRAFLRCLHGLARARMRLDCPESAAAALRRLVRLDPADRLAARASLTAMETRVES
jgi:hypothetical protein